jgi:hypothetical protein
MIEHRATYIKCGLCLLFHWEGTPAFLFHRQFSGEAKELVYWEGRK